jgi:hypothetical protein
LLGEFIVARLEMVDFIVHDATTATATTITNVELSIKEFIAELAKLFKVFVGQV